MIVRQAEEVFLLLTSRSDLKINFMADKLKILIADDHRLFTDGIVAMLKTEKDFEIAGIANDGLMVLDLIKQRGFDIAVLDINMPGLNGIEAAKKLRELRPNIKVIALTTHDDREHIKEMLRSGAAGYVLKNATRNELAEAIRKVAKGETYLSKEVQDSLMSNYVDQLHHNKEATNDEVIILTPREIEIVKLLAKGNTNDKIADELHISFRTVETHRKNIMHKTKSKNLAGLIKYAYDKGLTK